MGCKGSEVTQLPGHKAGVELLDLPPHPAGPVADRPSPRQSQQPNPRSPKPFCTATLTVATADGPKGPPSPNWLKKSSLLRTDCPWPSLYN